MTVVKFRENKCGVLEAPECGMLCPRKCKPSKGETTKTSWGALGPSPFGAEIEKIGNAGAPWFHSPYQSQAVAAFVFTLKHQAFKVSNLGLLVLPEVGTMCKCSAKVKWIFLTAWKCLNWHTPWDFLLLFTTKKNKPNLNASYTIYWWKDLISMLRN